MVGGVRFGECKGPGGTGGIAPRFGRFGPPGTMYFPTWPQILHLTPCTWLCPQTSHIGSRSRLESGARDMVAIVAAGKSEQRGARRSQPTKAHAHLPPPSGAFGWNHQNHPRFLPMAGAIRRNHRIGMANPAVSSRAALAMTLMAALLHPTDALTVSFGLSATSTFARSRPLIAYDGGGSESVKVVRDALMNRAVEQQLSSFAVMHDTARKSYLYTQWTQFIQKAQAHATGPGSLTLFISHLQRSKTTSVFVPKRMFRQLSPGNPYAPKNVDGHHEEVRPTQIALSLISCREQLAEYWVELMPSLSQLQRTSEAGSDAGEAVHVNATAAAAAAAAATEPPNATLADSYIYDAYDKQLLLGIATKLAARKMLKDLSLRPSCTHLHDWLKSYLLEQHAVDLTTHGSVERLHANLVAQPVCIRGGALVDPADLSLELFQRSIEILELIEDDLRVAPEHIVPLTADFLESCLLL